MFNKTGINAAKTKRENAFSIADKNAAPHINITYTNIIRDINTVISILPGVASKPGANTHTTNGIKISNNIVMANKTTINQEKTLRANDSSFLESVYIGINIADSAPSPNKSRNKFGNLNAAKNISDMRPAPKTRAINMSRIKPNILLMPVIAPTPKICLPSFIVWIILRYTKKNQDRNTNMKKHFAIISALAILAGCAGSDQQITAEQPLTDIYKTAYEEFNEENYEEAAAEFLKAETQHPSSPWAPDALIMAAYSYYMDNDFAGAILTTDRFMRFHPGHKNVPYIMYLRGMCYYRQVSDVRREPGMSAYALQQFQALTQRFPRSEYAKNAENKINILKNYIAGKVMYSARNDMQKENWPSAISRLQSIVTDAQETVMTPEAMFRLTEAYTAIGLPEQAKGYSEMLKLNFPDNEWTKKLK